MIPLSHTLSDQQTCLANGIVSGAGQARPLDDIPDAAMERLAALGLDWFLSA